MKHDRIAKLLFILAMIACAFCARQVQSPLAKELEEAYFDARNTMETISDIKNAPLSGNKTEYTVEQDIPYFHINYVEMDPSGERVIIHYSEIVYSRRITESDGTYRVFDTGGGSTTGAELVKQDGQWKVSQYLGDDVHWSSDSLYVRTMLLNYDPAPGKSFSSFEEALAYAESDPVSMIPEPLFFLSSGIVKLLTYFTGGMGY